MATFLPVTVLLLLVTSTAAGGYGSQTTPSTSTPASCTPTPTTPPPPPTTYAMPPPPPKTSATRAPPPPKTSATPPPPPPPKTSATPPPPPTTSATPPPPPKTSATPPPPPPPPATTPAPSHTPQPATPPKPAHGYDDDNNKLLVAVRVVVEGLLLCQSCAKRGLDGVTPLPKAQVMINCRDRKHQVMVVADSNGYFHAEFSVERADDDFWSKDSGGACSVRLLSSPDPKCKMVSDIHLHDEGKHWIDGRGVRNVVYASHPLAFRPQKCPHPHPHLHHH